MTWQPIETAPLSGVQVIGALFRSDGSMSWTKLIRWRPAEFYAEQEGGDPSEYIDGWDDPDGDECCPTHWMPLPEPPEQEKGQ